MKHTRYILLALAIVLGMGLFGCKSQVSSNGTGDAVTFHSDYGLLGIGYSGDYTAVVRVADGTSMGPLFPSAGAITNSNTGRPEVACIAIPSNFQLKEWNTSSDGKGSVFDATTVVTQSMDVYAIWQAPIEYSPTLPLVYDSAGGQDTNSVYLYDATAALPITKPGKLISGKTVTIKLEGESNYDLANLTLQLVQASDYTKAASSLVKFDQISRGIPFSQTKTLTMSGDLATPSTTDVLLLKADQSVLTSQLGLNATITFTPDTGAFSTPDTWSVDLTTAASTTLSFYGMTLSYVTITQPTKTGDPVTFVPASWAYYSSSSVVGGFVFPASFDLSNYKKAVVSFSSSGPIKFTPESVDFTGSGTDAIKLSTSIGTGNTDEKAAPTSVTIDLSAATLTSVRSIALTLPVSSTSNTNADIYSITFTK